MNWYLKCLKQYADFSGRARRQEYWMFVLFNALAALALYVFLFILSFILGEAGAVLGALLVCAYMLATMIPSLAVAVRRLHDIGNSGWKILVGLIPLVGGIWLLVLYCQDSQPGANRWGANPKE